ncbi:nucleotide-sugar transmembrane transporter [Aureococcus anophagefferens]|nr:nucleotide-sugar transmembrane transporter [Aureococcus anophagefferens]
MTTVSPKSQEYMGRQRWGSKDGEGLVKDTASSIVREPASVDAPATRQQVVGAVAFYCGCSSTLLFLNKLAVGGTTTLAPGAVVVVQIAFATASCYALSVLQLANIGALTRKKVEGFGLSRSRSPGPSTSVMALRHSNVETFIVFRASTPLAVALLDYVFLGRSAPSTWSLGSLLLTAASATAYVATDAQFVVEGIAGYSWCLLYFALICFEMTFGKHLVSSLRLGVWESVWLTNMLALPMLWALAWVRGDMAGFFDVLGAMPGSDVVVLFLSCVIATLIGYAGWLCRGLVSATSYTLIGVANKLGTVLLAVTFLDKHASPSGVAALVFCILASSQYKQSPLRADVAKAQTPKSPGSAPSIENPKSGG